MSMIELEMPLVWKEIIETDKNNILIPTGRVSGKSKNTVIFAVIMILAFPYSDIVFGSSVNDDIVAIPLVKQNTVIKLSSTVYILDKAAVF